MATYYAEILPQPIDAEISYTTISGTVTVGGSPAIRQILIHKNGSTCVHGETYSDEFGDFSIQVTGGINDEYRVICIGLEGENSEIYEHVSET